MCCRNVCIKLKATRSHAPNSQFYSCEGRYENGQKRCQTCELFIEWFGARCPCCHTSLRTEPRPKKYRERERQKKLANHQDTKQLKFLLDNMRYLTYRVYKSWIHLVLCLGTIGLQFNNVETVRAA
jgi:hypothetical protein